LERKRQAREVEIKRLDMGSREEREKRGSIVGNESIEIDWTYCIDFDHLFEFEI
jgi:hypothetical protein